MNLTYTLGWTLLHFVWQGAAIAGLLAAGLFLLRHAGARARYMAGCIAMVLMLMCAIVTFLQLGLSETPVPQPAQVHATAGLSTAIRGAVNVSPAGVVTDYLPALVWAWFGGVIALTIRSLGGWAVAERFARRHTWPAEAAWNERFAELAKRLCITRPVRLAVSALAQVPAVVGWVRPVILVPAGIFTGLTAEQVEALLAHELAHVCRHDYLVNLLQTVAETLFFYHPAVWWVSRSIRSERENCCDDIAVDICGNAIAYARALTELEQMCHRTPRFAMAADGGSLVSRVQRLLRRNQPATAAPSGLLVGAGIVACLFLVGIAGNGLAQRPEKDAAVPEPEPTSQAQQSAAPIPARPAPKTAQAAEPKKDSAGWLDGIQSEGYKDLDVDHLIALKIHGVDAAYIRQVRAAGFQLSADQLVAFRIHGITADFISELKQAGLQDLTPDKLVALKIHDATPALIREIQSLGYTNLSTDTIVALRIHGVTPDFIREVEKHFKKLSLDQLVQLKIHGILD